MVQISPQMVQILRRRNFAEFFAGIGLVKAGLESHGWTVSLANDIDPLKYEMYLAHFPDAKDYLILDDVHKIDTTSLPPVTLATGSFPCKDLSVAGSRAGLNGSHSSAFWGFIQALEQWGDNKPPLVMLENVVGFLSASKGSDFKQALQALNHLGYSVDAFMLDAANFVPQSRERLFIIGMHENYFSVQPFSNTLFGLQSDIRPKALISFILSNPEIRWNIRKLPAVPVLNATLNDVLEEIPENDPLWWNQERAEYLLSQMSQRHRMIADQMIASNTWSYGTVFRRMRKGKSTAELRTDGIAGCLRTPSGGSAKQILFKAGHGRYYARLLTPREAARLMGIGNYTITVPFDQGLFGFGDAVCVPVIEWIAENYLNIVISEQIIPNKTLNVTLVGAE